MENWMKINGVDDKYAVSDMGRFWSANIGIMKSPVGNHGYTHLNMMNNNKSIRIIGHICVAKQFIPNPQNKPTVNHKNGIRTDNRVANLEWATWGEQAIHSVKSLGRKGAINSNRRKTIIAYKEGLQIVVEKDGVREMGRYLSIPYQAVQTGIKNSSRSYFGWKFECIYDPKWIPKCTH